MTDTLWQRLFGCGQRILQTPEWSRFAGGDWADRIMSIAITDRFHAKEGRSTCRWILQADGQKLPVYLKRHYQLPRLYGILATFWPQRGWSPAMQEWNHLEWARSEAFPVPRPIAAAEYIGPFCRLQSVLAVEELTDMLPLHEAIPAAGQQLDPLTFESWKRTLIAEMARLVRSLHERRRFHKDLYLCHFYVPSVDTQRIPEWHGRVHLIDLHRLGHHSLTWRFWQAKDLAQLLYSSEIPGVGARDCLRFWRAYFGSEQGTKAASFLRWATLLKWRRYRRHNQKRKLAAAAKTKAA